ncbi:Uncharacterised protein [Salmonella enterica subsp. enterica serovar Bovismorbificans]|uniref:Uncharacterized protein n=1 Tax=Salmonella enterica subsp. enterica serovar Bovismorbificans TaxID=58097 RepID=A0A655BLI4_SALET|nr:Uncharacterised protein [Salmonella enterica subsp. enterica serovar Bovismorbificans]CNT56089.1 Uncharacterised protein [Salmonella enterica subsp. enterica serovar Bovismorbificans]
MAYTHRHLFAAPVKQGAKQQHQGAVHHKASDMRRLTDKPGRGCADIRPHFRHNSATAHIQQAMPSGIQFGAN